MAYSNTSVKASNGSLASGASVAEGKSTGDKGFGLSISTAHKGDSNVITLAFNYNKNGHVIVEIQVDDQMRIPKGSSAELVTEMLGGCNLNLLLANNPRERFEPGDTIKGKENTDLMSQAATMIPKVEKTLNTVDSLVSTLNRIVSDPNIAKILANTSQLTANLNQTTQDLNKVIRKDIQWKELQRPLIISLGIT